jgi:hypothetical protein
MSRHRNARRVAPLQTCEILARDATDHAALAERVEDGISVCGCADDDHAYAAVEGAVHFAVVEFRGGLKPVEYRRPFIGRMVNLECQSVADAEARQVVVAAAYMPGISAVSPPISAQPALRQPSAMPATTAAACSTSSLPVA